MTHDKPITVVFDTRSTDYTNGKQYQSLIDQVNAVLQSGKLYHNIEITQWAFHHEGSILKHDSGVNIPFYRHFYHDEKKNVFGGGFMIFEVLEDLHRYYTSEGLPDKLPTNLNNLPDSADIEFTVTITLAKDS